MKSWIELKEVQSDKNRNFEGTVTALDEARISGERWNKVYLSEFLTNLLGKAVGMKLPYVQKYHYPHKIYNWDVD